MNDIRVLLVDDQELVRSGLKLILQPCDGFIVAAECGDGDEVAAALERGDVDVVIMDLRMRRVGGIDAIRGLRRHTESPPVLVLTTFDDDELLSGALRAGAAGFMLKDCAAEELIRAVRAVAAGHGWLDPAVTARVLSAYRRGPVLDPVPIDTPSGLTARERDVLRLVGHGLSNAEIGHALIISELTVKTYIGRVFAKLGVRDRAAAIVYAFDHEIVRPGEVRGRPIGGSRGEEVR